MFVLLLFCKNDYSFDYIINVKGQKNTILCGKKHSKKKVPDTFIVLVLTDY